MKSAKFLLVTAIFAICAMFVSSKPAWAASLSLSPASANESVGTVFGVDVVLDTGGAAVSGATAIINYDTTMLEVQSDLTSGSAVGIAPGANLTQVLTNSVDTTNGVINYSAGNLGANYTGRGVIATIHFKAIAEGTTQVSFSFDSTKTNGTSLVSQSGQPTNLLTTVNSGTYTIGTGSGTLPTTGALEDTLMLLVGGASLLSVGGFLALRLRTA